MPSIENVARMIVDNQHYLNPTLLQKCHKVDLDNEQKDNDKGAIFVFRRDSVLHVGLRLKNDIFAVPVSHIRHGDWIVFDQGETHGTVVDIGYKFDKKRRVSFKYETNLYTQKSDFQHLSKSDAFFQDYTTEQLHSLIYDNIESNDLITYELAFGVLEYIQNNDSNIFYASTQQKLLHNEYDKSILGEDFYEVENNNYNHHNKYGAFVKTNLGLSFNSLNDSETMGQNLRLYVAPEFSNLPKRNNVTLGVSTDNYFAIKNPETHLFGPVTIPQNAIGAHLGVNLPLSIHQIHNRDESKWSTNFRPELKVGLKVAALELGYSVNMVNGTVPNHIEQNKKNIIYLDNKPYVDQGDMGEFYLRLNFTQPKKRK